MVLALSTSGDSRNVIQALGEARRRGLLTIALVGYDGGRVLAERLADHVIVDPLRAHPTHPGGAGDGVSPAARAGRAGRARVRIAGESASPREVAHAGLRGAIAAMAMTGMRTLTGNLGLVEQAPPHAILKQRAAGLLRRVSRRRRRSAIELAHWGYGAAGGVAFALLPEPVRGAPWAGPVYGVALWLGFEVVLAPALGLEQAGKARPAERIALAGDHLLYGLVLSEIRRRPQA